MSSIVPNSIYCGLVPDVGLVDSHTKTNGGHNDWCDAFHPLRLRLFS